MSRHHIGGGCPHILARRELGQQQQPVMCLVQAFKNDFASSQVISTGAAARSAADNVIGIAEALGRSYSEVG
jgi:hypothetical protein